MPFHYLWLPFFLYFKLVLYDFFNETTLDFNIFFFVFGINSLLYSILFTLLFSSWFRHFYVFASVYATFSLMLALGIYFLSWELPSWLVMILDILGSSHRKTNGKKGSYTFCINCTNSHKREWSMAPFNIVLCGFIMKHLLVI